MANSGTFGSISFNPNLDMSVIEEIKTELGSELSDLTLFNWERCIYIGDPLDFHLIDFIVATIKKFKAESYVEDITLNCNR